MVEESHHLSNTDVFKMKRIDAYKNRAINGHSSE